jgi:hypothetical protein
VTFLNGKFSQVVMFLAVVAGFVIMAIRGDDTSGYVAAFTPILGAVFVASKVDSRSDAQDAALTTITTQTNGVLTARIKSAVAEALAEKDADPGPEPDPGTGGQ